MKAKLLAKLCAVGISAVCFTACQKNFLASEQKTEPRSINTITGENSCFNWETSPYVNLTNGQTRILPFYNLATTQIPDHILEDYKREEGWELLYNLLSSSEIGQNYLIFYNKFTGVIRTYYFLADDVSVGNEGMWGLGFNNSTALLNNTGYFATPIDDIIQNPLAISTNASKNSTTKGISRGWNSFDTEITYDPQAASKVVKMSLFSYTSNISQIALSGDISLNSEGTIVSLNSKNGLQDVANSAAKSGGDAAKDWIKNKVKPDASSFIKTVVGSAASVVIGGGVKEIINAGINLLFGSFIGKKSETTSTSQKIEFKTNGTITLNGTITSSTSNNVSPVSGVYTPGTFLDGSYFIVPCFNSQLGVWNLGSKPKVIAPSTAYGGNLGDPNIYMRHYYLDHTSIDVKINPDLLSEIDSYEVTSNLFYYDQFKGQTNWINSERSSGMNGKSLVYQDTENQFYSGNYWEEVYGPTPEPVNPWEDAEVPTTEVYGFNKKFVVKVTVTLIPKAGYDQTPIVITRSYLPEYVYE